MTRDVVTRLMETVVVPPRGGAYHVTVHARPRADGRWEGLLEFRSQEGNRSLTTGVETTQSSARAVFHWAAGLGVAFLEGAFERAYRRVEDAPAEAQGEAPERVKRLDGPLDPSDHGARIDAIAREVLILFRKLSVSTIRTDELFNRTTHANADLVRAFELLEKQWRFIVRRTVGGSDQLELTPRGGEALGLPAGQTAAPPARPHPRR